jgi:hypothetical protein
MKLKIWIIEVIIGNPNIILQYWEGSNTLEHKYVRINPNEIPNTCKHWWYDQNGPETDFGII